MEKRQILAEVIYHGVKTVFKNICTNLKDRFESDQDQEWDQDQTDV